MIEALHELAHQAGMSKINISIQPESEHRTTVLVQSIPHALKEDVSDEQVALRDALATPIIVSGLPGEIEAKFDDLVHKYLNTVKPIAASLDVQLEDIMDKIKDSKKSSKTKVDEEDTAEALQAHEKESADSFTDPSTDSL